MFIYRNKIEYEQGYKGITLTETEMRDIYDNQQRIYDIQDIAQDIDDEIEDIKTESRFASDWATRMAEHCVDEYRKRLEDNERIAEIRHDIIRTVVKEELNKLNIGTELFA